MWLSLIEENNEAWFPLETLTLLYPYKSIQRKIVGALLPYSDVIRRYSESTKQEIKPLTNEQLDQQPEIAEQNVALLKNAIELWKTATRVSDAISPILLQYSWHCFNSFFVYSFLDWEPRHTKSHGIGILLSDELMDIRIQIFESGLFKRLVDTLTILGTSLCFSKVAPSFENGRVEFVANASYLPDSKNRIELRQLLEFDPVEYEKNVYATRANELLNVPFLANSIYLPNQLLQAYLILFVASSIARYRPVLWHSILVGEGENESNFALKSSQTTLDYTLGQHKDLGLVTQVTRILKGAEEGTLVLKGRDGRPIT